jgi:hypothetical protein
MIIKSLLSNSFPNQHAQLVSGADERISVVSWLKGHQQVGT